VVALRHFFHWPCRIGSVETRGRQGEGGAYRGLGHDGRPVQDREERGERDEERGWKSGGGRVRLYTWRRAGLADEGGSNAMPDAVGGEGSHGAAKLDHVIHRYISNPQSRWNQLTSKLIRKSRGGIDFWRFYKEIMLAKLIPFARECQRRCPGTLVQEGGAPAHVHTSIKGQFISSIVLRGCSSQVIPQISTRLSPAGPG
jgi:hypothetical protein